MDLVIEKLKDAIATGEIIKIVYNGGSQPGACREIAPITITGDKVRARCYASGAVKVFSIPKIELITSNEKTPTWQPGKQNEIIYNSLNELYNQTRAQLESAGWHVAFENDRLSLHDHFKNGKVKKTPVISIGFYEFVADSPETYEESLNPTYHKSTRPWHVSAKSFETRAYASLDHAAETFLRWTRSLTGKE